MTVMSIILDGDGCWPDLQDKNIIRAIGLQVAALRVGTKGGSPSVAFRIDLEDGRTAQLGQRARITDRIPKRGHRGVVQVRQFQQTASGGHVRDPFQVEDQNGPGHAKACPGTINAWRAGSAPPASA